MHEKTSQEQIEEQCLKGDDVDRPLEHRMD